MSGAHRKHLILALGLFAFAIVDRVYTWKIAANLVNSQIHQEHKNNQYAQEANGPFLSFISYAEDFIKDHEKALVVVSALAVAFFTFTLWRTTTGLQNLAEQQGADMKASLRVAQETAKAARDSADAAVRSAMPFLVPRIRQFRLHPTNISERLPENATHRPSVKLAFRNIGATPAVMIRIGARLYLAENDVLPSPPPPIAELGGIGRSEPVPVNGTTSSKRWLFERDIDRTEIEALARNASKRTRYLRFHLIGYVVYDDMFDVRHTRRFCVKVRQQQEFQELRGLEPYNRLVMEHKPKDDLPAEGGEGDPRHEV